MMNRLAAASFLAFAAIWGPDYVLAQGAPEPAVQDTIEGLRAPVLTINQQRFFEESDFGKASLATLEAEAKAL